MDLVRSGLLSTLLTTLVLVAAGCSATGGPDADDEPSSQSPQDPATTTSSPSPSTAAPEPEEPTAPEEEPAPAVSVPGLAEQRHRGDRLRLGAVREQTAAYTSYDVTYRSRSTTGPRQGGEESYTISGVLNVPTGRGPFPAVVLAHGYIDPAFYVRGQGMTRERGYLASRGYIALHVDYRNHAESDDDPNYQNRMRLGYSADVINAVKALRASREVPVDDDRMALFGRSMGGGVILKALVAEPGLVQAAAPWASVSSAGGRELPAVHGRRPRGRRRPQRADPPTRDPGPEPRLLAPELLTPLLRGDHRAGADGARKVRRHLPAPAGPARRNAPWSRRA